MTLSFKDLYMRLGPLVCGLLRPPLHELGMIFNPGQHGTAYRWLFLFGIHEPGLTKIFAKRVSNSQPGLARVILRATNWSTRSRVYFWRLYPLYDCRLRNYDCRLCNNNDYDCVV